jgi:predicted enzyme related to lactoylglutathione lyase
MSRPSHFEIMAEDLARAIEFYSQVFGWQIHKMGGTGGLLAGYHRAGRHTRH